MFVPLTPDEERVWEGPCRHRDHNPPNMMVITRPMAWVCPGCGRRVVIYPPTHTLDEYKDKPYEYEDYLKGWTMKFKKFNEEKPYSREDFNHIMNKRGGF